MAKKPVLPERIFDCLLQVELQAKDGEHVAPVIIYRFPPATGDPKKDATLSTIPKFCFPVNEGPKSKMEKETFSFVLTESDGARSPCFGIFRQILDEVELRAFSTGKSTVPLILEQIVQSEFPQPGQSIEFPVVSWKTPGTVDTLRFTRPSDDNSLFDYVNFAPLLQLMDPVKILWIFASLCCERRTIFVSDRLSTLSSCVQACVALLYPFTWQHVFIPVLPLSLIDMCCAPMPFVVGILSSYLPEVAKLPLDATLMVDLDNNKLLRVPGNDYELLPSKWLLLLHHTLSIMKTRLPPPPKRSSGVEGKLGVIEGGLAGLTGFLSGASSSDPQVAQLSTADARILTTDFARFFAELFVNYQPFMPTDAKGEFQRDAFISAAPLEHREFLSLMLQGQMFERWIEERREQHIGSVISRSADFDRELANSQKLRMRSRSNSSAALTSVTTSQPLEAGHLTPAASASSGPGEDTVKKGALGKYGTLLTTKFWKKKWFVLDSRFLSQYSAFEDWPSRVELITPLANVARVYRAEVTQCDEMRMPRDQLLVLELLDEGAPSTWYLSADSKDETTSWLTAFSNAVKSAHRLHPPTTLTPAAQSTTSTTPTTMASPSAAHLDELFSKPLPQVPPTSNRPQSVAVENPSSSVQTNGPAVSPISLSSGNASISTSALPRPPRPKPPPRPVSLSGLQKVDPHAAKPSGGDTSPRIQTAASAPLAPTSSEKPAAMVRSPSATPGPGKSVPTIPARPLPKPRPLSTSDPSMKQIATSASSPAKTETTNISPRSNSLTSSATSVLQAKSSAPSPSTASPQRPPRPLSPQRVASAPVGSVSPQKPPRPPPRADG